MEQPLWTPEEEVIVEEEPPAIDFADASRELEPLQTMGRMGALPTSWGTTKGVALRRVPCPEHDDGDLHAGRHRGAGRDLRDGHRQGAEQIEGHHQEVATSLPAGQGQRSGKGRSEGSVKQLNGTGGEMPFQGAAGSRMQTGGLGGEIPFQRSDNVRGAGHRRGVSHGYGPEQRQGAGHRRDPSELRDTRRLTAGTVTLSPAA
eukprot:s345_g18.t1